MSDEYKTILHPVSCAIKVRGSRFICDARPSVSREQAQQFIASVTKKYFDATHHPFAYRIGVGQDEFNRSSDDGEPSGTAARPILQAILSRELTNVTLVVTRYFGGTKLGTGGLARAYSNSALAALDLAVVNMEYLTKTVNLKYQYDLCQIVEKIVHKYEAEIIESHYDVDVSLALKIRDGRLSKFQSELIDQTSARIRIST